MNVLVTGGRGFIGAWTTRALLDEGHRVRVADVTDDRHLFAPIVADGTPHVEHVALDVTDAAAVTRAAEGCDAIVHLAAIQIPFCRADPLRGAHINVLGTLHVFEAAKTHKIRGLAYASSAAVFGPDDGLHPNPQSHYGAFKLCNEGNARAYWLDAGISSVGLRPLTVYGPGREIGLTSGPTIAMRAAAAGEPYTIGFTGPTGMDWIGDVAALFARCATATPEGAHALTYQGQVATVDEVIAAIRSVVPDARIDAHGPPVPIAAKRDDVALRALIADPPQTPLLEGTRRTIEFYRVASRDSWPAKT